MSTLTETFRRALAAAALLATAATALLAAAPLAALLAAAAPLAVAGCASSAKPVDNPPPPVDDASSPLVVDAGAPESPASAPVVDAGPPGPAPILDAGAPAPIRSDRASKVKVQYIGMHVGGGPFDEATKKPFEKAIAPHHPEMAECWAKHVTKTKAFDMGVDLLIEGSGGHPKVSNPRVRFEKGEDDGGFVSCIIGVFEAIDFPTLARGKSGVSYSLRFTPTP